MQLKFFVPLALALVSSVFAATRMPSHRLLRAITVLAIFFPVPSMDMAQANEACANGEVSHTETITVEGKEVKMTTMSCPGLPAVEPANQLAKRDVQQCNLSCNMECYEIGKPVLRGDCYYLSNVLASNPGMFLSPPHTITTFYVNDQCDYNFYNFDSYNYDVCYGAFASVGSAIANQCTSEGRGAGDCFSNGMPEYAWAVEIFNPFN